jgi:transposase
MSHAGSGQRIRKLDKEQIYQFHKKGVRGHGLRATASHFRRPIPTVQSIIEHGDKFDGDFSPQAKPGRPPTVNKQDIKKMLSKIERDPFVTTNELADIIGNKVTVSDINKILKKQKPPVVRVVPVKVEPQQLTEEAKEENINFISHHKHVSPQYKRVYGDEAPIYGNTMPGKARAVRGGKVVKARTRYSRKYLLHMYARKSEVVYWELASKNADDAEIRRVAVDNVLPEMKEGEKLFWDKLGRSGRAKFPDKLHFNRKVAKEFKHAGMEVVMLPAPGHYLNPMELLFNDLKEHYIKDAYPKSGKELSKQQLEEIIEEYVDNRAQYTLPGFFEARASGKQMRELGLLD